MSSRVGTAIPASRSTAWSSAGVGFMRSIQTAFSGSATRSARATFFSEVSEGTYADNMKDSGAGDAAYQQDLARFWQALHDGHMPALHICGDRRAATWRWFGAAAALPKNQPKPTELAVKKTQPAFRSAARASKLWNCGRL